jgi:hypothetical protein
VWDQKLAIKRFVMRNQEALLVHVLTVAVIGHLERDLPIIFIKIHVVQATIFVM